MSEPTEPAGEELAGEPTLAEAIENITGFTHDLEAGDIGLYYKLMSGMSGSYPTEKCADHLRRLTKAGEFEEKWPKFLATLEMGIGYVDEPFRGAVGYIYKKVEELTAEKDRQLQVLRRQLDDLGKENAGKGRRIGELKKERKAWQEEVVERGQIIKAMGIARDHRLDEDEEIKDLRSQLAEKETEQEELVDQLSGLRDQLTEKERELKGLNMLTDEDYDRLNRFNSRIQMLETKMRMIKRRKPGWFKGNPDPKPTEAEKKLLLRLAQPTESADEILADILKKYAGAWRRLANEENTND